jgi:hypothetical protein
VLKPSSKNDTPRVRRRTLPWAVPFGMGLLAAIAWLVLWSPSRVGAELESGLETELGPIVALDKPNAKQREQLIDEGKRADLWARILVCDAVGQPIPGARLLVADSFRDSPTFIEARGPVLEIVQQPKDHLRVIVAPGFDPAQVAKIGAGDWACQLKPVQTTKIRMQAAADAAEPVRIRRLESEGYQAWFGWLESPNEWVEFDEQGRAQVAVPGINVGVLSLGLELESSDNRRWLIPHRQAIYMRRPEGTLIDARKTDWVPLSEVDLRPPYSEFADDSKLTVSWDSMYEPIELSIQQGRVLNPTYVFEPNGIPFGKVQVELNMQVGQREQLAHGRGHIEWIERRRRLVLGTSEKAIEVLGDRPTDYSVVLVPIDDRVFGGTDKRSMESCDVPESGRVLVQDFATVEPREAWLVHKASQQFVAYGEWKPGEATLQLAAVPRFGVQLVGGAERSDWHVEWVRQSTLSMVHTSTQGWHASLWPDGTIQGQADVLTTQDEAVYRMAGTYQATLIENEVRFPMPDLRVGEVDPNSEPELLEVEVQLPELISTKGFVRSSVGVPTASVVLLLHFESGQQLEATVFGEGAFAAPQYPSNRITRIEYVPDSMANRYGGFPVVEIERQDASGTYAVIR